MASQEVSQENRILAPEFRNEQQVLEDIDEDDSTSDYSSMYEQPILGSFRPRPNRCHHKTGHNTPVREEDFSKIYEDVGREWKSLGLKLSLPASTLHNISDDRNNNNNAEKAHAMLMAFKRRNGSTATKGWLADALIEIGRKDLSEKLIGNPEQRMFFLTEEGHFDGRGVNGQLIRYSACRSVSDGCLYLVRKLEGTGFEESCKVLKEEDSRAVSVLQKLDVKGIEHGEREKNEKQLLEEAEAKLQQLIESLKSIQKSLETQERRDDAIDVKQQLYEDEELLKKMQDLISTLLHLTGTVRNLKLPFSLEAQLHYFSIGMSAIYKDLDQRFKMLMEMQLRKSDDNPLLNDKENAKLQKLLKWSQNLGLEIELREKPFIQRYEGSNPEYQRVRANCRSEPPSRLPKYPEEFQGVRRSSTQPVSQNEFKDLEEQVAPPPDPMEAGEEKQDIWSTDS